jgi:hypothetical protein
MSGRVEAERAVVERVQQARRRAQHAQAKVGVGPPRVVADLDEASGVALSEAKQVPRGARRRVRAVQHRLVQVVVGPEAGLERPMAQRHAEHERERDCRDR